MRRAIMVACVFAFVVSLQGPAWAATDASAPAKPAKELKDVPAKPVPVAKTSGNKCEWSNDHVRLGVAGWMSMGEGEWEITFEGWSAFTSSAPLAAGMERYRRDMIIPFGEVGRSVPEPRRQLRHG